MCEKQEASSILNNASGIMQKKWVNSWTEVNLEHLMDD
jgi:hypothetical protein